jgi:hypothetical protein
MAAAMKDPLFQTYRPPITTPEQVILMANLTRSAKKDSAVARQWVVEYMGSDKV